MPQTNTVFCLFIENVKRLNLGNPSWSIERNIMSGQEVSGQDKSKAPPEAPNCMEDSPSVLKHSLNSSETSQVIKSNSSSKLTSNAHQQAEDYLRKRKIYELTNFLISHLLVDEPDDPIEYLGDLLEKCMFFKHGLGNPPLIFTDRHINGIFSSFDQGQSDAITLDQYREAMKLLGISQYDENPPECTPGYINKETFSTEAIKAVIWASCNIIIH
ncbi:uncharacterized protein [Chelonus insularis]|uniref:uncharacterized protein isoform X2 n=1 Tax=Chelonus insularis TaxID=460826 RepID=UPI00158E7C68|nr:uncharacterized protein LOC118066887 isoform X2 [Chelonus insularis]